MKVDLKVIKNFDTTFIIRIHKILKEISPDKWRVEPIEVADLVGIASIPDISRYLIASGHSVQTMELAVICTNVAINNCWSGMDVQVLFAILNYTDRYIDLAKRSLSKNIKFLQASSDARAKTDTVHDSSATASAVTNIARAVQHLLSNSSEYILTAIDDALYAISSEPNQKEIISEIEAELRKIIRECP